MKQHVLVPVLVIFIHTWLIPHVENVWNSFVLCLNTFCFLNFFTPFFSPSLFSMTSLIPLFSLMPSFLSPPTRPLTLFFPLLPPLPLTHPPPSSQLCSFYILIPTYSLASLGTFKKKSPLFFGRKLKFALPLFHYLSCPPFISGVSLSTPQRHCFT